MLRRAQELNLPTAILRTIVTIADLGSFSKAGAHLGLTQPAISAQMKRIQILVGGPIFSRTVGGVTLSDRGRLLMPHIRRLLEVNDQILQFGGAAQDPRPIRLGLSDIYCESYLETLAGGDHAGLNIICDHSNDLLRGLVDGYVDVACLLKPASEAGRVVQTWNEEFVWVRSPHFVVSPGSPIPLVGWPGLLCDQIAINALEAKGIACKLAFSSYDRSARIAAVSVGIGICIMPKWAIPPSLIVAREYYLPAIAQVAAGLIVRNDIDIESIASLLASLSRYDRSEALTSHKVFAAR